VITPAPNVTSQIPTRVRSPKYRHYLGRVYVMAAIIHISEPNARSNNLHALTKLLDRDDRRNQRDRFSPPRRRMHTFY
jgi:hypothetical protein